MLKVVIFGRCFTTRKNYLNIFDAIKKCFFWKSFFFYNLKPKLLL
jgi:hypothetical protein